MPIQQLSSSQVAIKHCPIHPKEQNILPLATATVPKFDDDYMERTSFSDLFKIIASEQQMSKAHKMWYLKTKVIDEAANLEMFLLND